MSFSGREYMSETNTQRRSKNSLQSSHLHYAIPDIQIHVPDEDTDANYSENSSASSETDVDSTPQSQLDSIEGNFFEESQNPIFYDDNLYNSEQENAFSSIMDLPDLNNYMVIPNVDPSKNARSKSNSNHSVSRSNYFKATTEEGDELPQNYIHNKQPDKKSGFLSSEIPADKQRRKSVTDLAPFMQPRKSIVELTPAMQARISVFETNLGTENQILKSDDTATERRKSLIEEIPTVERRRSIRAEVLELERRYLSGDERANPDYLPETKDEIQALQRRRSIRNEILSFERRGSMQDQTIIPSRRRSRADSDENLRRKSIKTDSSEGDNEIVMRAEVLSPEKGISIKKKILEMERRKSIKENERVSTNEYRNTPEIEIQPPDSDGGFSDTEEQYFRSVKPYLKYRKSISELEPYFLHQSEALKLSSSVQEEIARLEEESAMGEEKNDAISFSDLTKNNFEQEHSDFKSERGEYQEEFESENMNFPDSRRSSKSSATSKERHLVSRESRPVEKVDGDQDINRKQLLEHQNSIAMEESEFISRRLSNDPLTYSERDISDSTISHSNRNSFSLDNVQKSSRKNSFSEEGSLKSSGLISSQGDIMQINETSTEEPSNYLTTDSNIEVNQRRKSIALEVLGFLTRRISNALETDNENQTFQKTDEQEFQEGDYKSQTSSIYNNDSKSASRKSSVIDRKLSQGSTPHEALSCSPQESISPNHDNLGTEEIVQYDQRRKSVTMEALDFMVRKFSSEPIPDHQSRRSSINPEDVGDLEETEKMQSMTVQMYNEDNRRSLSDKGSRRSSRSSVHNNHRLSRGSVTADDQYGTQKEIDYVTETSRSRRSSASAEDGHRSQRGSIAFERGSVSLEFDRKSQRNSLINEDGNRSRRSSINDNDDSVSHAGSKLVDDGQRSRKNSAVMEDERSHRGSISDSVSHRSPRGSISLHESHTPNRGSGLFNDARISPRGSISSERNYRSRQGSTSVDEGQRSRSGSVTIQDGQRSHRNSFYEEEQAKSRDSSRKGSIDGRISPRGSISNERNYRSRQGSTSVDEGQRSRSGSVTIQDGQRSHRNSFYEEEQEKSRDRSRKSSIMNDTQDEINDSLKEETHEEPRRKSIGMEVLGFIARRFSNASENEAGTTIPSITVEEHKDSQTYESPQGSRRSSNASFQSYHRSSADEHQRSQRDSEFVEQEAISSRKSSISSRDGRRSQRGSVSAEDGHISRKGSMSFEDGTKHHRDSIPSGGGQIPQRLSQEVHEIPALQEKTIDSRKSSHTQEVNNVSQFSTESDTEPNDIKYDKYKVRDSVPSETSDVILHHYIQRSFSEETPEITDYVSDSESGSELNFELALNEIESDSQSTIIINGNQVQNYKMTMQQKEILVMNKYKDEKETPDLYEALYGHIITLLTLPELGGKEHELCATFIPDVTLESSINDTEWNEISQKYKNITGFSTPGITQMSALTTLDRKGGWTTADALQNQKKRKPLDSITTVTFCGCGFLGGYLVGAATYLQERAPHLLQGRLAGSSVGSLIAACLACDVPLEYVRKNILATADVAQKYLMGPFNPFFPIEEPLLKNLLKMIPEDGHIRASGRLYLSLTRATTLTNEIVSEYSSRDELVRAILCCCFLPFISGFSVPSFNGRKYIDGGMSNNMPLKGPNTLSINAFSGVFDICPEDPDGPERPLATAFNQSVRMTNNNLTRLIHSLLPPTSEVLDKHFQQGYDDAKNYFPLWNTK